MRINYKSFPFRNRGVPEQKLIWRPILPVKIIYGHTVSKRFEAVVDSGSDYCLTEKLLGQIGFFDHFIVTFDFTPHPPAFEIQRILRS